MDLAWLRSTPWRERVAATLRPAARCARELRTITARHGPPPPRLDRRRAAARRLARLAPGLARPRRWSRTATRCAARPTPSRQDVALRLQAAPELQVPGLEGLTIETAAGRCAAASTAAPAGCARARATPRGDEREWTIPGASRGETGVLGEGIRQALLRDPTYVPALQRRAGDARRDRPDHLPRRRGGRRARGRARSRAQLAQRARASAASPTWRSAAARTPGRTYELLGARARGARAAIEVWFADERCVAPEDAESNYRLAAETLLEPGGDPAPSCVHRMEGELGPGAGRRAATPSELRERLGAPGDGLPVLDLVVLGIGPDGHIASLFPGAPTLDAGEQALCLGVDDSPKPPPERITLSLAVLRAARGCLLLATGAEQGRRGQPRCSASRAATCPRACCAASA